jgi:outer membrane usher protein
VSQNKVVFFEQTVPPGPFEFDDINPVSSVGDLQVVIAEADGSQQSFVVPYSQTAGKLKPGAYLYNIAAGIYRNASAVQQKPSCVANLCSLWSERLSHTWGGSVAGTQLQQCRHTSGVTPPWAQSVSNSLFSRFTILGSGSPPKGLRKTSSMGLLVGTASQLSAGVANQSRTYTTPSTGLTGGAATLFANDSFKSNRFIGLGVSLNRWGGVNVSASQQRTWQNAITQQLRLGYANNLGLINFSVNLDHATSSRCIGSIQHLQPHCIDSPELGLYPRRRECKLQPKRP